MATELNFSWGMGPPYPDVNVDNWMAVWGGQMYIPGNDTYTFYVASEKGTVDMKINRTGIFSNHYSATLQKQTAAPIYAKVGTTLRYGIIIPQAMHPLSYPGRIPPCVNK